MPFVISEADLKMAYDRVIRREGTMEEIAFSLGCRAELLRKRFNRRGWPSLSMVLGWQNGDRRNPWAGKDRPLGDHPYIPVKYGEPCVVCDRVCEEGWWTASTSAP